jgi:GNAT superfamily N-acetyltransferase
LSENKSGNKLEHLSAVEPLTQDHIVGEFNCGKHTSLTEWLRRYALQSQQANSTRTYVVHRENCVVGYYSLSASSVRKEDASERAAKYQPGHPIPVILLARLAVDKSEQNRGLGSALLKNALQRCLAGSREIGARAVLVHAIDRDAKSFYQHYGFEECPVSQLHLMLLIKDIETIK